MKQTSKTLNYLDSPITVPYFSFFIGIWIYLRHYLNIVILASVILPWGAFTHVGSFTLDWETQQYKCWISQWITFALLAILQVINLLWLFFILRVAYNVVAKELVTDVRSDDEGETDGAEVEDKGEMSESDLSRQVSASETASALERVEPGKEEDGSSRFRRANGNANGHAVNGKKGLGLELGAEAKHAAIDARKGSLKEGSDEDDKGADEKERTYVRVQRKKDL